MSTLRAWLLDDDGSHAPGVLAHSGGTSWLDKSKGRKFSDTLNDEGSAQVTLPWGHEAIGTLTTRSLVRFDVDGTAIFTAVMEAPDDARVDPGEEGSQGVTWTGQGLLSEWGRAPVYGPFGSSRLNPVFIRGQGPTDNVRFDWTHPDFDDSGWSSAVVQDDAFFGAPQDWLESQDMAAWVYSEDVSGDVPAGVTVYRRKVTLDVGWYIVQAAADDRHIVFIDGREICNDLSDYYRGQTSRAEVYLDDGEHTVALWVDNTNALKAGVRFTMLAETGSGDVVEPAVLQSDASWVTPGYVTGDEPGMTAGEIIALALAQSQTAGYLSGWTTDTSASADSASVSWGAPARLTVPIGSRWLDALHQLSEAYVDLGVPAAARTLRAWGFGTRGTTPGVSLVEGTNLLRLHHRTDGKIVNRLLVRSDNDWSIVEDSASVATYRPFADQLRLEGVRTAQEAEAIAQANLIPAPAWSTEYTTVPELVALASLEPGNTVTAPDETGSATAQRVRSRAVDESDDGTLTVAGELRAVVLEERDRTRQWLRRVGPGAIGGRSAAPVYNTDRPWQDPRGDDVGETIGPFGFVGAVSSTETSGPYVLHADARVVGVRLGSNGDGSGTTSIQLLHDFTPFGDTVSMGPTDTVIVAGIASEQFRRGESVRVQITAAGGHNGFNVIVVGSR